jgi:putative protease
MVFRPEILAPAGDHAALRAAMRAGADAVYFGLKSHNARARATNFDVDELENVMAELHAWGVKGYVTLNVLAFDHELSSVEETIRACARAGVDAIIVQDLGVVALARAVAPSLAVHASTQMTCSDAAGVELAAALGASRVVLARELSLEEIARIRAATAVELEVFVHGALCVSYSGQCLTSEAIGGRSANRGACAQACRLPYDLVVDGAVRDLGDVAYLLSPEDLEAASLVPKLAALSVQCLKIEGRLKEPQYVAATTRLYRSVVDALGVERPRLKNAPQTNSFTVPLPGRREDREDNDCAPEPTTRTRDQGVDLMGSDDSDDGPTTSEVVIDTRLRDEALRTFSRGSGPGFLAGTDHQRLVEGLTCEHRGVEAAVVAGVRRERQKQWLEVTLKAPLKRGDGIVVQGGRKNRGEVGGRIWDIVVDGVSVDRNESGPCELWLGPDVDVSDVVIGRRIFHNDDPALDREILKRIEKEPVRERIDVVIEGDFGAPFVLRATSARGRKAMVVGDVPVEAAQNQPLTTEMLRDKIGRLGDTPFVLDSLVVALPAQASISPSALNRARRSLVLALTQVHAAHETTTTTTSTLVNLAQAQLSSLPAPPAGLFVLARTAPQALAALRAGADGVWLDFLAMTGLSDAVASLRQAHPSAFVGVAPPRIRKPGEEKITRFLSSLPVDGFLVRGLGALYELSTMTPSQRDTRLFVGDFSLNVANCLCAREVLSRGLHAFTPSFDLDEEQLKTLLARGVGRACELVIHHPMPLFHTEHCVFAATLSEGRGHDFRTCGRPCEQHVVSLRDRVGLDHPVEADVGCRNTVFHAVSQSAASLVGAAQDAGASRFRIELVRETPSDVAELVLAYRTLLSRAASAKDTLKRLRTAGGYGVVKGSLRVLPGAPP